MTALRKVLVGLASISLLVSGCSPDNSEFEVRDTSTPVVSGSPTVRASPTASRPTLIISSPTSGGEVTEPFAVVYEVQNYAVGPDSAGHMIVTARPAGGGVAKESIRVNLVAQSGEVRVDDVGEGTFDLEFVLANPDGSSLGNKEASVIVKNVKVTSHGAGGGGLE